MMDFSTYRPRPARSESVVPMINVVFLLLIFFLMSAQIAPPDPFDITPPVSGVENDQRARDTLYLSADGGLWYEQLQDDEVWTALASRTAEQPLRLKADKDIPARVLAQTLPRLATAGVDETVLVVGAK